MVVEFILLGFQNLGLFRVPFFTFIAFLYTATVATNLSIILLISSSSSKKMKSPMYVFLSHLSLSDILISTAVAPNALQVIILGQTHVPTLVCITQLYFLGAFSVVECCLLTVMSYDRYLAICRPLRYTSIMNANLLNGLITYSWLVGILQPLITHTLFLQLEFCGPNVIDHFFCDAAPLLELSCSDRTLVDIEVSIAALFVGLLQMLFIIITYILIFHSIFHMSSKADTTIQKDHLGNLSIDLYHKPTDRNNLLPYSSNHPPSVKKSLPISQFSRVNRIVSNPTVCQERLNEMSHKFRQRGYPERILKPQPNTMRANTVSPPRIPFVHKYHPSSSRIVNIIHKHWPILRRTLPEVAEFQSPPMTCYKREKKLRDHLVRADIGSFARTSQRFLGPPKKGTFPCLRFHH
ncbi:olfactory receptor 5P4-like [Dendropsophus ebraccatus]|uniref:olfactory receptor 5P4-like n=1 Tax=Dendropsophus ebraccatus TaxID=150705 RepID=UPI0038312DB8